MAKCLQRCFLKFLDFIALSNINLDIDKNNIMIINMLETCLLSPMQDFKRMVEMAAEMEKKYQNKLNQVRSKKEKCHKSMSKEYAQREQAFVDHQFPLFI